MDKAEYEDESCVVILPLINSSIVAVRLVNPSFIMFNSCLWNHIECGCSSGLSADLVKYFLFFCNVIHVEIGDVIEIGDVNETRKNPMVSYW